MSVFLWTAPLFKYGWTRWSEDDFRAVASRLRPYVAAGGSFADLGGGTGYLGAGVAHVLNTRVVVIDPVPQMLSRVPAHPLVSTRLAKAEVLPFPGFFAGALCSDAFHHMQDQDAAARELARVVPPGGGVLRVEMKVRGWTRAIAILERILGEPAGFKTAEELEDFLRACGIAASSSRRSGGSYCFFGSVMPRS